MTGMLRLVAIYLALAPFSGFANDFRNLDFEEGSEAIGSPAQWAVPIEDALPGWRLFQGAETQSVILINLFMPRGAAAYLSENIELNEVRFAFAAGRGSSNDPPWRLEQTATIPAGSKYMAYRNMWAEMEVEIEGQIILPLNVGRGSIDGYTPSVTNLIYDVSKFAGTEVTLAFLGPPGPFFSTGSLAVARMDSIRFVSEPPALQATKSGNRIVLSWPASSPGFVLQSTEKPFNSETTWQTNFTPPIVEGDQQTITVPIGSRPKFFRLGLACPGCGR